MEGKRKRKRKNKYKKKTIQKHHCQTRKSNPGPCAQEAEVLAATFVDLSFLSGMYTVEGANQLPKVVP